MTPAATALIIVDDARTAVLEAALVVLYPTDVVLVDSSAVCKI